MTKSPTQQAIFDYIKDNNGMSASPSVIGRAINPNYTSRYFPTVSAAIQRLKKKGLVSEIDGRYYTIE